MQINSHGHAFLSVALFVCKTTMKPYAEQFYKSIQWRNCRSEYMKKAKGLCEDCLKENKITPAEEVHHIKPITPFNVNDPEITLNFSNLVALCRECHRKRHGARERRYTIDEYGRVMPK